MISTSVRPAGAFRGLFAEEPVGEGEVVARLDGVVVDAPSTYTLQIGAGRHLTPPRREDGAAHGPCWRYLNHSCAPNTRICLDDMTVRALRDIAVGEELTFNYLTTELELDDPFTCRCGAPRCFGEIRGFAHLSAAEREALLPVAAPHLRAHALPAGAPPS